MILAGQITDGGCASTTVIVNEQVAILPAPSVTKKLLVVTPTGNVPLDMIPAVCIVTGLGQLSVPTGVP